MECISKSRLKERIGISNCGCQTVPCLADGVKAAVQDLSQKRWYHFSFGCILCDERVSLRIEKDVHGVIAKR